MNEDPWIGFPGWLWAAAWAGIGAVASLVWTWDAERRRSGDEQ